MRVLNPMWMARGLVGATACCLAAVVPAADKKAEDTRTCAASPAELSVIDLRSRLKKKGKFVLNKKSECFTTPDGRNLSAVLVELPAFTESYSVNVRSLLRDTVLVPRIDVLDAQKSQRRSLSLQDARRRGDSLEIDVFVTKNDTEDRYLVLYADPGTLGQEESRSGMGINTSYIGTGYWMSGKEDKVQVKYVDEGALVVTLKGPQWDKQ